MIEVEFSAPPAVAGQPGDQGLRRTITGLAVPFGVPSAPESVTGCRYQFSTPPTNAGDLLDLVRGHDDDTVIGRLHAALSASETGLEAQARVFSTTAGNDALVEAQEGVFTGFSIGAEIAEFDERDGVRHVTGWTARHLGLVRRPAFSQAKGIKVAAEERTMPETETVALPTSAELVAEVAELVRAQLEQAQNTGRHPLAEFADEAAYTTAFFDAQGDRRDALRAAFAVPDQITGDNPGLMAPQWRAGVKQHLDARRPAITTTGGPLNLPDSGMSANWAYLDPALDLDAVIGQQLAEKTDLAGIKIKVLTATQPILTAGTVSDISYQLLRRSSPAYLTTYLEVCRAAYARYTERVFEIAVQAGGTASGTVDPADASAFAAWLFEQSAAVEDATGSPATVVGVAPDVWLALGSNTELMNRAYGTQNVPGVASAATLSVEVNGLRITRWPFLAATQVVVTNGSAVRFAEQGPMVADAEDVRKLGRDVAVWGMYETAEIYFPAGIRTGTGVILP